MRRGLTDEARLRFAAVCLALVAIAQVAQCGLDCSALRSRLETDLTWREKRAERRLRDDVLDAKRYIDNGVVIKVVVRDPNGEALVPGNPALVRVVRELGPYGGIIDTKHEVPFYCAPTRNPSVWFCSEDQAVVLEHDDPEIPAQLIKGSEGSGKTKVLAMLHYLWWTELVGDDAHKLWGQSAPTKKRLKHVLDAMRELYPRRWFKYHKAEQLLTFCTGHAVQFISTKKQSEASGSPGQGYNLARCGRDELQDQVDADHDLESRGRAAPIDRRTQKIHYKQAATCTAKPSPEFRDLQALKLGSGLWIQRTLLIVDSPFIDPSFLERASLVMTEREVRRRFWCEDLPPEHMVYFNWSRAGNLKPIPTTAKRVTSIILRAKLNDPSFHLLAGHDPGTSKAATVYLDGYECGCKGACKCGLRALGEHAWWVRGERFTTNATTEQHAELVLKDVRETFGYNRRGRPEQVHVRAHPYGQSEDKPSLNLYRIFKRVGLHTLAAQYAKTREGTRGTGTIRKEDRLELVNRLLCDAAGRRRLFVETTKQGTPVAPRLVEGFETMERDERGLAEHEKKNEGDKSDPPAALGYALWPFEKESSEHTREVLRQRREAMARGGVG